MNILLTSSGRRSHLVKYFKLLGHKVYCVNSDKYSSAMYFSDDSMIVPPTRSSNFLKIIGDYSKENKIDIIIPLTDLDVLTFSENIHFFKNLKVEILVSPKNVVRICSDKWLSYKLLKKFEIPQPKTYINLNNLTLHWEKKLVNFPILMKPRLGSASRGVIEIESMKDLRNMHNIYVSRMKKINLDKSNKFIYQEKIIGEEFALTVLNDNSGKYLDSFSVRKIFMRSGETDAGYVVKDSSLQELAKKLSGVLSHHFYAEIDTIKSRGKHYPIDINLRFAGSYQFLHSSGVNLPEQILRILKGHAYEIQSTKMIENKIFIKDVKMIEIK